MHTDFRRHVLEASELARMVPATHLWVEHLLIRLLSAKLPKPEALFRDERPRFLTLAVLAEALGITTAEHTRVLRALNTMRNKFAHELSFSPDDAEIRRFMEATASLPGPTLVSTLPPSERELALHMASVAGVFEHMVTRVEAHQAAT
jgi:hypothetical protein